MCELLTQHSLTPNTHTTLIQHSHTHSYNTHTTLTQHSHNTQHSHIFHTCFTHVSHSTHTQHLVGGVGGQITSLCAKVYWFRLPTACWWVGEGVARPRGSVDEVAQSSPPTRDTWGGVGGEGGEVGADPARHNSHEFPDRTGAQQVRGWVCSLPPTPSPHQHVHLILPAVVVAHPLSLKYSCRESIFTKI